MKTRIKKLFSGFALLAGFSLLPAGRGTAQTFTTLYSFNPNGGGSNPQAAMILSGNTLYGVALNGTYDQQGEEGVGDVFAINMDRTGFRVVLSTSYSYGGVILSGNMLYGTASEGGSSGTGNIFAVNTAGTFSTNLHSFAAGPAGHTNSDGISPWANLVLVGNTLYGTALEGGTSDEGTVFAINTDGSGFTNLHNFSGSDGSDPYSGLILSGNTLYGTTSTGGLGSGTVFAINTDGTGFTNLYNFTPSSNGNRDGAYPRAGLILSGNVLYGTTFMGGSGGNGTVFAVNTDGTGFTNLHSFTRGKSLFIETSSNLDGAMPAAGLILSGNTLYGTTTTGGPAASGTVFAVNTDGTEFTNLHDFTALSNGLFTGTNSDGAHPYSALNLSSNTLYGTTGDGGYYGLGTVFSLSLPPPQLAITQFGNNVILTWPANVTGFNLQCASNLSSPTSWTNLASLPAVVNGSYTVTNAITGAQTFYRLAQ